MNFLEKMDIFWYQLGKLIKLSVWIFLLLILVWILSRIIESFPQ
jgi:hypothetical protein